MQVIALMKVNFLKSCLKIIRVGILRLNKRVLKNIFPGINSQYYIMILYGI